MPPRRSHTKSRMGCDQCKKRRVKCDETGPPCANCIARELSCSYYNTPKPRSLANGASASPVSITSSGEGRIAETFGRSFNTGTATLNKGSNLRELELMHKFSTETYLSLSNRPSDYHVWQMVIPRKALEHDFLLNGVLAVAALHVASTLKPPDALTYIDTALEYHNRAFAPYRQAIDNLTPMNCDAVFAHSVLTTVIGIALPRLTAERDESSGITENIVVVFELLQGVSKIFKISRPWLTMQLFTSQDDSDKVTTSKLDSETERALNRLAALNDDIVATVDPEQYLIVKDAISGLHECFTRHATNGDAASVLRWLAVASKEFAHALRCRKPFPLMVLMYWGVLLGELDGKWWWAKSSGLIDFLKPARAYRSSSIERPTDPVNATKAV
ncbi:hypothetical protein CNMCM6069_009619 [Aspergillus lentulus]|nr:hypothetical protein CNMCM6069_009619 [Aspergillus lentulus]KAF4182042.1 hypothetical protein CNMCM7927_000185 [Aspergillus lentulus]